MFSIASEAWNGLVSLTVFLAERHGQELFAPYGWAT